MLRDDIGLFVSADHRSKEMQCVDFFREMSYSGLPL